MVIFRSYVSLPEGKAYIDGEFANQSNLLPLCLKLTLSLNYLIFSSCKAPTEDGGWTYPKATRKIWRSPNKEIKKHRSPMIVGMINNDATGDTYNLQTWNSTQPCPTYIYMYIRIIF